MEKMNSKPTQEHPEVTDTHESCVGQELNKNMQAMSVNLL